MLRSPVLANTLVKFPLIDRLVPPLLDGDQTFSFSQLLLHGLNLQRRKTKELGGFADNLFSLCRSDIYP